MRAISTSPTRQCRICSAAMLVLLEVHAERFEHLHRRGAPGSEYSAAGMLKRTHQIEAIDTGHHVLPEFRGRAMRAALITGGGDAVQVAAPEAGRSSLHVDRAVDMDLEQAAWNVGDELRKMIEHTVRVLLLGVIPAAAIGPPVGH